MGILNHHHLPSMPQLYHCYLTTDAGNSAAGQIDVLVAHCPFSYKSVKVTVYYNINANAQSQVIFTSPWMFGADIVAICNELSAIDGAPAVFYHSGMSTFVHTWSEPQHFHQFSLQYRELIAATTKTVQHYVIDLVFSDE